MKRWLTTLAAGLLAAGLATAALAQDAKKPGAPPAKPGAAQKGKGEGRKRMQELMAKLNLTPEQKTKVTDILKASREEGKKIRSGSGTPEEKKSKMHELQQGTREKWMAVLTPEQQKQAKELVAQGRKKAAKGKKAAKTGKAG